MRATLAPEPLLEFARWWLYANVPKDRTDARWVQGDTGPGQFLHHDGHLTALLRAGSESVLPAMTVRSSSVAAPAFSVRSSWLANRSSAARSGRPTRVQNGAQ